ncbi:MAG: hypothetical protein ACUVWP_00955 [bacterium]
MMKNLTILAVGLILLISGISLAFHDYVWTYEWTGQNFFEKSLMLNGHFTFMKPGTNILFPIEAGFAFDKLWSASFIIPIEKLDMENHAFGIGNMWAKGKFIPMLGPNISLGPRFAIRLPIGSEGHKVDQLALDLAGLVRMGYVEDFPMVISAQTGIRLEFAKDEIKAPSYFYFIGEPGFKINWRLTAYGVIGFAMPITKGVMVNGEGTEEYDGSKHMWFGGKATMKLSPSLTADGQFQYRIWEYAEGADKSWFVGAGVTANIHF